MDKQSLDTIQSLIGRKVFVKKPHPRAGETGTIKEFYQVVGITGKPGFEIEADDKMRGNFFVFDGKEVQILK